MTSNSEFTINPALLREVPYDLERDFNAITTISDSPLAIVTRARAPFNTPQEMLAYTKAQGKPLQYASVGAGSLNHLVSEWMASSLGLDVQHIPHKGGAPAIAALLSEEIQYGVLSLAVTNRMNRRDRCRW
jgi:tripartite-type tricarboxylate transporter receptor subunit TctC